MRFLANENLPRNAIAALRDGGHDVVWIREESPGVSDSDVLARATSEQRVLLTFDKDFGELAFRAGLPSSCGVVLFRLPMPRSQEAGSRLAKLLGVRTDWTGHFSVIEAGRIRMRKLPR